ncbi:MAG: NHL repeat-containing protein [Bacteroidota bacterium]
MLRAARNHCNRSCGSGANGLTRACRRWSLAALLAALLAPSSLPAADLAVPECVISGFEDGARFQVPRGVALDPLREELVVANTGDHRVEIFSDRGRPLGRFIHYVTLPDGSTAPGLPRAVAVLPTGRIALTDNLVPTVDILDRRGNVITTISLPSSSKSAPQALALTPDGGLLIAGPPGDDRVYRFDATFHLTATWGVRGREPGQLNTIAGLVVLPDRRVAVACIQTRLAVQIFSFDGAYLTGFGIHEIGHGNFSVPSGITATSDGRIWVADEVRQVVQVFDKDGALLGMLGGFGLAPGDINYPSALAGDGRNRIVVAERELGRVQILIATRGGEVSGQNARNQ